MPALTADLAFEQAANAAYARWQARPAFVSYTTHTHIEVPSMHRVLDIDRRVMTRSSDNKAVLQDLPRGARTVADAFPISPTFDALAYFRLMTSVGWHQRIQTSLEDVVPLHFDAPAHTEGDVVVSALRYYYPKFAPDSSDAPDGRTHLTMRALPTLTTGNNSDFYLSDLIVDNATQLPLEVTYAGREDRKFIVDYQTVGNAWVIRHAYFEQTLYGPLHVGRVHYTSDATFSDYTFPATPPAPELG
ncbi:MAG: hypothetical protein JOY59_14515 [Candidatus Eremiobacteraeota bacterium]|nr:hypothetical protein [Candidatus Eremiobacteraeota bacterium]